MAPHGGSRLLSILLRDGAYGTHAFEAVLAQAVNATQGIDHPGIAGGGWAVGAPGRPGPEPGNQTPGRRS